MPYTYRCQRSGCLRVAPHPHGLRCARCEGRTPIYTYSGHDDLFSPIRLADLVVEPMPAACPASEPEPYRSGGGGDYGGGGASDSWSSSSSDSSSSGGSE